MSFWKHLRAVLLLPAMATIVIPGVLLFGFGPDSLGLRESHPVIFICFSVIGGIGILSGLVLVVATIRLLGRIDRGTLAPWNPTQQLVVAGIYRRVRNPMISGVVLILL